MEPLDPFDEIVAGAGRESRLWASALLPQGSREAEPSFSPLAPPAFAVGLETVYEAYLVHYGRPRLFAPPNRDEAVLLGDYLYAHGLVRIAEAGGVPAVATMAELISRCASLRADGHDDGLGAGGAPDGGAWVAAARSLGGEPADADIDSALARHSARVAP